LSFAALIQIALMPRSSNQPSSTFFESPAKSPPSQSAMLPSSRHDWPEPGSFAVPSLLSSPFANRSVMAKYITASRHENSASSSHTGT